MKKIISMLLIVIAVFMGAVCLVACDENESQHLSELSDSYVNTWTDDETGVQYIIVYTHNGYGAGFGITARLNADGTPYIVTEGGTTNDGE